jgi:hypothetical protein
MQGHQPATSGSYQQFSHQSDLDFREVKIIIYPDNLYAQQGRADGKNVGWQQRGRAVAKTKSPS